MLLVVDANELFAAIIASGRTLNLFFNSGLELVSPVFILDEFREHKAEIMEKSGLNNDDLLSFLLLLKPKIKFFNMEESKEFVSSAKEISPDPNDVEYFALALKLNCVIWSEDKKLKKQSLVKVLNADEVLALLRSKLGTAI